MQFTDLIGDSIFVKSPLMDKDSKLTEVKLLGVEAGGLWIQSQVLTNAVLDFFGASSAGKTPIFFLPYHEIICVVTTIDEIALGEKAFGV
jgi:hypothetical protein